MRSRLLVGFVPLFGHVDEAVELAPEIMNAGGFGVIYVVRKEQFEAGVRVRAPHVGDDCVQLVAQAIAEKSRIGGSVNSWDQSLDR